MYPSILGMEASEQFFASVNVEVQEVVSKKLRLQCSKISTDALDKLDS